MKELLLRILYLPAQAVGMFLFLFTYVLLLPFKAFKEDDE